jgi:hypothetical protein
MQPQQDGLLTIVATTTTTTTPPQQQQQQPHGSIASISGLFQNSKDYRNKAKEPFPCQIYRRDGLEVRWID